MRWLLAIAVVLVATAAHADGDHFTLYGLGPAIAKNDPGWALRIEKRLDATRTDEGDEDALAGGRIGVDVWSAGSQWGFSLPVGMYFGAQVKHVRTSLGGGLGLWAFARSGSNEHYGVAPFASSTVEVSLGKLMVALDGRVSRQTVFKTDDFNVYSVMFMVGKRFTR